MTHIVVQARSNSLLYVVATGDSGEIPWGVYSPRRYTHEITVAPAAQV